MGTKLSVAARLARKLRGQAMVEYSAVMFALATAGGVGIIIVLPSLMNALDRYLAGIYFMLNLAIP
jgi:ABC-type lipoprotein release transport system permease subunit